MTATTQSSTGLDRPRAVAHWLPLAVLMAGTFMFVLDFFIVNVALPSIQRAGPEPLSGSWPATA